MNIFNESGISFDFGKGWECIKFDEEKAYKRVSDNVKHTKGIDFIGIYNRQLVIIEVKNFANHTSDIVTKERLKQEAEELMTEIAEKIRDSLACVSAAARFSTNNHAFWKFINQLILDSNVKVKVIAWIEFDERDGETKKIKMRVWRDTLKRKLQWLHAIDVSINNIDNPPPLKDCVATAN
ncbi:hypothetical protein EZS27_028178 [termite gut metagenome]|uniref:NERD domain-containing protein n=1 Tax=termite gut metagenome TaxID=433724 RepID=A0A5J4QNL5_9ZZZZ